MPTELHVLLSTPRLPTLAQWQATPPSPNLPLTLYPPLSPPHPTRSPPPTPHSPLTAFEFHLSPSADLPRAYPGLKGMFPTRDLAAPFRFGPDPTESACALAAIASLAHAADGV